MLEFRKSFNSCLMLGIGRLVFDHGKHQLDAEIERLAEEKTLARGRFSFPLIRGNRKISRREGEHIESTMETASVLSWGGGEGSGQGKGPASLACWELED